MLKNSDRYSQEKNPAHISYRDYKRKTNNNKDFTVFISVFVISVLIILGFVKILSPNVDVGIAGPEEENQIYEDEVQSGSVDQRLKKLKMEDEGAISEDNDIFSPEYDEKVHLPSQNKKTVGEIEAEQNIQEIQKKVQEKEVKPETKTKETSSLQVQKQEIPAPSAAQQSVNAKVVVGYYSTEKQAEVAKSIIHDAGLGVTPIVKNMNGYYTLQVGAFSSKEKAQQAANNLLKSNFPARVIVE